MAAFFASIAAHNVSTPLLAVWVVEGESAGTKALFAWDGAHYTEVCMDGDFPADSVKLIREGPRRQTGMVKGKQTRLFLEPVTRKRRLVICGAGHVALSVIKLGVMLDYELTVIDDREAFTQKAADCGAHHVLCAPFEEALNNLEGDPSTAFVVMTREHLYDVECLRQILKKSYAYLGMMGSRSRTEQIRKLLLQEGFDAERLRQVHMPIGLSIGSRTPEEIAVSVMAEVIAVMNGADSTEDFPPDLLRELTVLETKASGSAPDAVLAMIVEKHQEAPRKPGTKMLVKKDGRFLGTVGGGTAEARILEAAKRMIHKGCRKSRLIQIVLEKGAMYCGGEIEVFLLPL